VQQIAIDGRSVGISGLEDIFRNWLAEGKQAPELSPEQILQEARKHNYIVPRLQAEYAAAIRALYSSYCKAGRHTKEGGHDRSGKT
jgi:hypothetical protein